MLLMAWIVVLLLSDLKLIVWLLVAVSAPCSVIICAFQRFI